MHIIVNGTKKLFQEPLTVEKLLEQLGLDKRKLAVERNREIVPKAEFTLDEMKDTITEALPIPEIKLPSSASPYL